LARIRVATRVAAPAERVWADIRNLASHVEWMNDAVAIDFVSPSGRREGVGTEFICLTKIGPIRLRDRMTVTEWDEGSCIGIRHAGVVTGTGVLRVRRRGRNASKVTWEERLTLPWWMGGPFGGVVAKPILKHIWKGSLANLSGRFDP
jgi:hypothetical protein